MNAHAWTKWFLITLMMLTLAGCATQRINWQTRVGNYNYDQAVREYGPPDKHEKLSDGTIIADWLVREGHTVVAPQPYLAPPNGFGAATPGYSSTYMPSYYMRLTFGAEGELKDYKNFTR
ncbi:MAG TPA: hypothetical protein VE344_09440 [Methylomirabilota bacterium]|nr:hypothetical protein [Methylomirabilota bacterium]